jgi:hypothetical protein
MMRTHQGSAECVAARDFKATADRESADPTYDPFPLTTTELRIPMQGWIMLKVHGVFAVFLCGLREKVGRTVLFAYHPKDFGEIA